MQIQTLAGQRQVYDQAVQALMDANLTPKEIKDAALTQSYIRQEVLLVNGQTSYRLPFLVNDTLNGPVRPTEQRVNLQDAHYCYGLQVLIAKASSATDTTFVPQPFPDPVTFPTGAASLGALYNGKLTVNVNNVAVVPAIDILQFYNAPQTQLTAATNSPITQFDGSQFINIQPQVVIIGQKNSQAVVTLPAGTATTYDANTYLILKWFTVLAQNVTVVS